MSWKYILEPYRGQNTRHKCPNCGQSREFTRYIDTETGQYLADDVGICNRKANCRYHYSPREFLRDNPHLRRPISKTSRKTAIRKLDTKMTPQDEFDTIDPQLLMESRNRDGKGRLFDFVSSQFGVRAADNAFSKYNVGTWSDGRTVFWQIDINGKIRTGKVMQFNRETGRRLKDMHPSWIHNLIALNDAGREQETTFRLDQCFFGEHLLAGSETMGVGVVESEKTAIIASIFFTDTIWITTGGCSNLRLKQLVSLVPGRSISLFPDSTQYKRWSQIASGVSTGKRIHVSNFLERRLTEEQKQMDLDLADIIIGLKSKANV